MDSILEKKDEINVNNLGELRNLTVTLSGTERKAINRFSKEFYEFVLKFDSSVTAPLIIPTVEALFTTRKSPCGNGTATFSKHCLKVFQRVFTMSIHDKNIAKVFEFLKTTSVDANIKMNS
jgi:ribosomal protein S10